MIGALLAFVASSLAAPPEATRLGEWRSFSTEVVLREGPPTCRSFWPSALAPNDATRRQADAETYYEYPESAKLEVGSVAGVVHRELACDEQGWALVMDRSGHAGWLPDWELLDKSSRVPAPEPERCEKARSVCREAIRSRIGEEWIRENPMGLWSEAKFAAQASANGSPVDWQSRYRGCFQTRREANGIGVETAQRLLVDLRNYGDALRKTTGVATLKFPVESPYATVFPYIWVRPGAPATLETCLEGVGKPKNRSILGCFVDAGQLRRALALPAPANPSYSEMKALREVWSLAYGVLLSAPAGEPSPKATNPSQSPTRSEALAAFRPCVRLLPELDQAKPKVKEIRRAIREAGPEAPLYRDARILAQLQELGRLCRILGVIGQGYRRHWSEEKRISRLACSIDVGSSFAFESDSPREWEGFLRAFDTLFRNASDREQVLLDALQSKPGGTFDAADITGDTPAKPSQTESYGGGPCTYDPELSAESIRELLGTECVSAALVPDPLLAKELALEGAKVVYFPMDGPIDKHDRYGILEAGCPE